jgi:hypothetical protein
MTKENRAEPGSEPQNVREQADRIEAEKSRGTAESPAASGSDNAARGGETGDSTGVGGNPSE